MPARMRPLVIRHAKPPLERFLAFVERSVDPTGCWLWTGGTRHGYGKFTLRGGRDHKGISVTAHAWIYEQIHGKPFDSVGRHLCHARRCVRWGTAALGYKDAHVVSATQAENIADQVDLGTHTGQRLSWGQVREIRRSWCALFNGSGLPELEERRSMVATLASVYGLGERQIQRIVSGAGWVER